MNPFPHVAPGGYTKYYQKHAELADSQPVAHHERTESEESATTPPSARRASQKRVKLRPFLPRIHIPGVTRHPPASILSPTPPPGGIDASITGSAASSAMLLRSSKSVLLGIPEGSSESGKKRIKHMSEGSATLRRRKRRMLKTSVELDVHQPFVIAGALSDTCTSESENTSTTLHGSSVSCEQTSPNTPATLYGDEVDYVDHKKLPVIPDLSPPGDESDESDCSQAGRPESRSSFLTAKSEFSD